MWEIIVEIDPNVTEEERKVGMSTKESDEPLTRVTFNLVADGETAEQVEGNSFF